MPCVPTLKARMFVAVEEDMKATEETVQVSTDSQILLSIPSSTLLIRLSCHCRSSLLPSTTLINTKAFEVRFEVGGAVA